MEEVKCSICGSEDTQEELTYRVEQQEMGRVYSCADRLGCLMRVCAGIRDNIIKATTTKRPKATKYVIIYNASGNNLNTGMYWSGVNGWGSLYCADRFMQDELSSYRLPEHGRWAQV
jgi:hypothetical protein